ncbi:uncharacterized protein [Spinacia oleracea]|uniref:Reverse transcriptase domain-containing protein n=1 Tax=Spinacia oleracea TaxID=3562 RepID=A0ABM3RS56_SPIOL|nr:uncharacterized protein LOC130472047 [Spinacia oleracea]
MGDFNSVLYSGDIITGNAVTNTETVDFENCLGQTDLTELKSYGHYYSWYKGHEVLRISSRIDRGFGNHTPLVMSYKVNMKKGGRPFKIFNYMADHPHFMQAVQKGWEDNQATSAMQTVWNKLKAVKVEFKALHKQDFAQLENKIEMCRRDLDVAQSTSISNPDDTVAQEAEKECVEKLNAMKERYAINSIDTLYDDHGTKMTTDTEIQAEIKKFYEKLIGTAATSLTGIDVPIVRHGIQLSVDDAESLFVPVSDLEIDTAIKGINVNKAPGLDGFNSFFFHKTWSIVKADIYNAVREFFDTGVLPKPINNTVVTLIPKIQNASNVKDSRPIACCSVVYKIISKNLTARMQGVIGKVVHCA